MSTVSGPGAQVEHQRPGRSRPDVPSLVLAGLLLALGTTLAIDASTITNTRGGDGLGPAAFPWAIAGVLLVLGVVLALVSLRGGRPDEELDAVHPGIDAELRAAADPVAGEGTAEAVPEIPVDEPGRPLLRAGRGVRVLVFAAGLVAHALLVNTAGYVVAALVLFVAVALAFGAPRIVRVLVVGLVLTLVIFYAFTVGLGLPLPNFGGVR